MHKKTRLLKLSAILFTTFSLAACGPKPTICISNPAEDNSRCYDYEKKVSSQKTFIDMEGMICLSPVDFSNELDACKRKMPGPLVNACVVSILSQGFRCFDQVSQKPNVIPWEDTENYGCVSPQDQEQLLKYCKTLKMQTN